VTDKPDAPVNEPVADHGSHGGQADPMEFVPPVPPSTGGAVRNFGVRRRIATVAGSLALAGAVVAGAGFTVVTVNDADRDAGAPVWKFPKRTVDDKKAPTAKGLAGALVPYGGADGWTRGPDLGEYGSDAQLSGAEATALRKESLSDLPRTLRKKLEKEIDRQKLTGMAMRSYLHSEPNPLKANSRSYAVTVSITLSRMESTATVKEMSTFQRELLDSVDIYRKGPEIKGHKNAGCFLTPKDDDTDLDTMVCSAYEGNILVSVKADGGKPLDTQGVATLLRDQLDRITDPGKAV
jgi:hypothetical protein